MTLMLKFLWYLFLDLKTMVWGLIVAPSVAKDVGEDWNIQNPYYKAVCQTPDSLMNGYGGDEGFYKEAMQKYEAAEDKAAARIEIATDWQRRNTTQGYSTWVLGLDETGLTVTEKPMGRGYRKTATKDGKAVGFEWKIDLKYPFIEKRFVIRSGWKFGWDDRFPAQFAGISIRPWQSM